MTESDHWCLALIWLVACALDADWSALHDMAGAFTAGATCDVRLVLMPVHFLSTGLLASTMLTLPTVTPRLARLGALRRSRS